MGGSTPQASKGQHKRAASTVPPTSVPQNIARPERDGSAKEISSAASPLERLPTEILEMIFLYSLNLSLPRASPVLGKRLASNHMKTILFLLVFPSEGPQLRHLEYLLGILGTEKSIGNLQSDILALKWATPEFVRELTEPFMVRTIVYVFREHGLGWVDDSRKIWFDDGVLDVTKEANIDVVSRFYKRTITGGKIKEGIRNHTDFMEWVWEWPTETARGPVEMYIGFREGQITVFDRSYGIVPDTEFVDFQSRLIFCAASFRIPAKLLHGPWSDDKCTELLRISRGGGRIDQTGNTMDEEVADTGLREAIIEENQKAIVALIGSITMYNSVPLLTNDFCCQKCISMSMLGSQAQTHGTHCEDHIHLYCVGLTVRTDHVKLALNKDCSHRILYTLLHAMKIDLDWADTELTAWAVQKKKEDDERGQWLLDRLASSNIARYKEDYDNKLEDTREREEENTRKINLPSESDDDE